ncbi:MAG: major capsid protein [Arcobacteraceae bacterium]|jgi:hypothetical protein|nr:major capsid protein [Arcobacteraceae bacterium]
MLQTVNQLLKNKWSPINVTEKLLHLKPVQTVLFDKYVKDRKGQVGATFEVKIKKGAGVILESISPEAEHLVHDRGDVFVFNASTARYALANPITPEKLDNIASFEGEDQALSLAEEIGDIQREHKESFDTSLEFQTAGALFNKVMDGKGKVLFELNYNGLKVEFKSGTPLKESINEVLRHIKKELGVQTLKVSCLAGPDFMDGIFALAKEEDLFKTNQAKEIDKEGENILVIHGMMFTEYIATYQNADGEDKEFIPSDEAVFLPEDSNIFKLRYSRANDTKAAGQKPKLYFGAVEELPKGRGWEVRSECRPLVYNSRPSATPKGKFIPA